MTRLKCEIVPLKPVQSSFLTDYFRMLSSYHRLGTALTCPPAPRPLQQSRAYRGHGPAAALSRGWHAPLQARRHQNQPDAGVGGAAAVLADGGGAGGVGVSAGGAQPGDTDPQPGAHAPAGGDGEGGVHAAPGAGRADAGPETGLGRIASHRARIRRAG